MRPDGIVLEAPTSTIFWVSRRRAANPGARTPGSSTRSPAARWSRRSHVEEGEFPLDDLLGATEAFLASTVREIQPVSAIDATTLRARAARRRGAGRRFRARGRRRARRGDGADDRAQRRAAADRRRPRASSSTTRSSRGRATPTAPQKFDLELARRLGEMGYLGAPVAEEYGGRGLDFFGYGLIVEEVGRGDSAMRTVVSVQTSLVCGSIERWGIGGAEAALAAEADLRARRSAASGSPSPTPAPTPPTCAPGPRRSTAAGGSPARRCGSRSATSPRSR